MLDRGREELCGADCEEGGWSGIRLASVAAARAEQRSILDWNWAASASVNSADEVNRLTLLTLRWSMYFFFGGWASPAESRGRVSLTVVSGAPLVRNLTDQLVRAS